MRDSEELQQVVHAALVSAGVDYEAIYRHLEYSIDTLANPKHRGRHEFQKRFWRTAQQVTGDPEIGLTLCPHLPVFHGEALEYVFLSSRTLGEGLDAALEYQRLVSDALDFRLITDAEGSRVQLVGTANDHPVLRHSEVCFAFGFMRTMRSVTGGVFQPNAVRLAWPRRASRQRYNAVFECPVYFGACANELWVDREILETPSPHYSPELLTLHQQRAAQQLREIRRHDLVDRVQDTLLSCYAARAYAGDKPTMEDVARRLGMGARRLRSELQATGACFRALARGARFQISRQLLENTDEPISDVAEWTGFSERSTFARAFRDWTGQSPLEYREHYADQGARRASSHEVLRRLANG